MGQEVGASNASCCAHKHQAAWLPSGLRLLDSGQTPPIWDVTHCLLSASASSYGCCYGLQSPDSGFVWGQCPLRSPCFCWLPTSTAARLLTGMSLLKACCEIGCLPGEAGAAAPWPGCPRPALGPVLPHTVRKHSGTSSVHFLHNCISPKGIRPVVKDFRLKVRGPVGRCEPVQGHLLQVAEWQCPGVSRHTWMNCGEFTQGRDRGGGRCKHGGLPPGSGLGGRQEKE